MRWVIATDDFPPLSGGVATWTAEVADGLHAAGHDVVVLARARPGMGVDSRYPVVPVSGPSFGRWGGHWIGVAAAPRLHAVDRVLATTWPVATALVPLGQRMGFPVDVVAHGSDVTRPPVDPRGKVRVLDGATRRFAVSHYLADLMAAQGWPAEVLPPPVDAAPARTPHPNTRTWGMAGRATPLKGGDRFVRLVAEAKARGVVVGDGPALAAWRALARDLRADVRFLGHLDRHRTRQEMSRWDLAVLLPRTHPDGSGAEGYGLALAEAAALGVATVGCRTGGVPEAVGAGLLLEDPEDVWGSVRAIRAWWRPDRGEVCRRWIADHGGVARVVALLEGT